MRDIVRLPDLLKLKHGNAVVLGATRIVLCFIFLMTPEREEALRIASFPRASFAPPEGLGWFVAHIPITPAATAIASRVYLAAAVFGFVGLYTRLALSLLLLAASYLFAIRQLGGAAFHDMHLLWFLAVLAASHASRALSVDEVAFGEKSIPLTRRLTAPQFDGEATNALFWLRTLLGIVYFFPGLWKLRESGIAWALSSNLEHQIHAKWFQHLYLPSVRIDHHPTLLHVAGVATIAFELGFIFLVHIGPRTRVALAAAGVLFHLSIERMMLIPFSSLWCCYVALLPPPLRSTHLREEHPIGDGELRNRSLLNVVGALLLLANVERGARGITQSFPFACYPTFQWMVGATLPDLIAEQRGVRIPVARDANGKRSQSEWGEVWSVAGIYGAPFSADRLRAFLKRTAPTVHGTVDVHIGYFNTAPEAWGEPPVRTTPLAHIDLP